MESRGRDCRRNLLIATQAFVFLIVSFCPLVLGENEGQPVKIASLVAASTEEAATVDYRQMEAQGRSMRDRATKQREQKLSELNATAKAERDRLEGGRRQLLEKHNTDKAVIEEYYRRQLSRTPAGGVFPPDAWAGTRRAEAMETSKREYESGLAELDREQEKLSQIRAAQAAEIERDYRDGMAKADMLFRWAREVREYQGWSLPADPTESFKVQKIEVHGNTALSDAELLENLPPIYRHELASTDGERRSELYDFQALCWIIAGASPLQPVSTRTMEGLTRYILSRYQRAGYAGVYVYVSADAIAEGEGRLADDILPVRVIEGRLSEVWVERRSLEPADSNEPGERVGLTNPRFWLPPVFGPVTRDFVPLREDLLKAWLPVLPGGVMRDEDVKHLMALLNTNPDRYVTAVMSAGREPNAIDVTYELQEGDPWHFYTQVTDAGTDEQQWSPRIGLVNTNVTGRDDRASIMYQADVDGYEENYAAFGTYDMPFLTPRLRLGAYGGYSRFDINSEATGGITSFLGDGSFFGATVRYNLAYVGGWLFDLTGFASSEESRVARSLGLDTEIDLRLLGIGAQVHRTDYESQSIFAVECSQNVGGSDADEMADARTDADPDFFRYSAVATHRRFIDVDRIHEIRGSARAVASSGRLVPAKMMTFGGLYTVRGYEEDEIVADGGILASLEYRFNLTGLKRGKTETAGSAPRRSRPLDVWLLGFTDYGRPDMKDPVPGEVDTQDMWSIGVGTLFEVGGSFQAAIYHGWALRETKQADGSTITDSGDGQWNFNLIYRW